MARKELTRKEWDQANGLSDELMTLIVSKGTSVGVSVITVTFLMAKALLSLSDNNKVEAHVTLAIDEFEFSEIKYN